MKTIQVNTLSVVFPAERLIAYGVAKQLLVEVARVSEAWCGWRELREQARSAALSVFLNLSEGGSQPPGSGAKRRGYDIAQASCGEVAAALDAAEALGLRVCDRQLVARLALLLGGLTRRFR